MSPTGKLLVEEMVVVRYCTQCTVTVRNLTKFSSRDEGNQKIYIMYSNCVVNIHGHYVHHSSGIHDRII